MGTQSPAQEGGAREVGGAPSRLVPLGFSPTSRKTLAYLEVEWVLRALLLLRQVPSPLFTGLTSRNLRPGGTEGGPVPWSLSWAEPSS